MKIAHKLAFVLTLPIVLTWVVVLYATSSSEESLSKAIEQTAVFQAHSVMEEVDHIMHSRIANWVAYGQNPDLQEVLRLSNIEFGKMGNVREHLDEADIAWRKVPSDSRTPLMERLLNNDLSKRMRVILRTLRQEHGFPVFGEVFVTNRFGANIAQTNRTSDYRQDDEDWWRLAKQNGLYVAEVNFDESAGMYSTDICIRIDDNDGNFLGVIKAVLNIKEAVDIVTARLSKEIHAADYDYFLFNSERQIIHSSEPSKKFLEDGSAYFDGMEPPSPDAVFTSYRTLAEKDGLRRYFFAYAFSSGFSGFSGLGWSLVIKHDAEILIQPVRTLRNHILSAALAATIAALVFGSAIAISLSRRLRNLKEATIDLGHGNLERTVEISGSDELTQLATHFNNMTAKLKEASDKLKEQAASLEQKNAQLERHISERKHAEEALREERDFAETLIETAHAVVLVLDKRGNILRFNRYMEELCGYRLGEVRGKNWFTTFVPEREFKHVYERFEQSVSGTQTRGKVNQIIAKNGTRYEIEWYDETLKQRDGSIIGLLAIGHDITERAFLQTQLAQAQKLEAIGQLAAGIAHEINTPTQFVGDNVRFLREAFTDLRQLIERYAQLLEADRTAGLNPKLVAELDAAAVQLDLEYLLEETPKAVEQSLEGIERVTTIVRSMKEFSHPGGKNKELTDLNRAVQNTITVARNEWKYVAEMVTDFDDTLPAVPVLVGEFNQAVLNIIINAAHAIEDVVGRNPNTRGTITVSTGHDDRWVEIRLSDTGTGMPEEIRKKIFDPFFTTKDVGKGTGQGLAIAHAVVVQKHGGTIDVQTEKGKGTTFVIRLPTE